MARIKDYVSRIALVNNGVAFKVQDSGECLCTVANSLLQQRNRCVHVVKFVALQLGYLRRCCILSSWVFRAVTDLLTKTFKKNSAVA